MADAEESPGQRQARLRREKREKKILEGGSARLEKITGVSGRSIALGRDRAILL
jgi:GET complex subunit GET2